MSKSKKTPIKAVSSPAVSIFGDKADTLTLQLHFHSFTNDTSSVEKIMMNPRDIKILGLKIGSIVCVESPNSNILCKVWPSQILSQSQASICNLWRSNFPDDNKTMKISKDILRKKCIRCHKLTLFLQSSIDDMKDVVNSILFKEHLFSCIYGTLLTRDQSFSITWRGSSYTLKIAAISGPDVGFTSSVEPNIFDTYFEVVSETVLHYTTDPLTEGRATLANVSQARFAQGIGGYHQQVSSIQSYLALGIAIDRHHLPDQTSSIQTTVILLIQEGHIPAPEGTVSAWAAWDGQDAAVSRAAAGAGAGGPPSGRARDLPRHPAVEIRRCSGGRAVSGV